MDGEPGRDHPRGNAACQCLTAQVESGVRKLSGANDNLAAGMPERCECGQRLTSNLGRGCVVACVASGVEVRVVMGVYLESSYLASF